MGLDNSIMIKRNEYSNKIQNVLKPFVMDFDIENKWNFEVCYWRKCWNIRDGIANVIEGICDNDSTRLNIDNIKDIISLLKKYNKKNWEVGGGWSGSIWTWEEHKKSNKKHIKNLKLLYRLMKKYPELEVYFYDSY